MDDEALISRQRAAEPRSNSLFVLAPRSQGIGMEGGEQGVKLRSSLEIGSVLEDVSRFIATIPAQLHPSSRWSSLLLFAS